MNRPGPRVDVEGVLRHSAAGMVSPWVGVSGRGVGEGAGPQDSGKRKRAPARGNYRKDWWARQGTATQPGLPSAQRPSLKSSADPPPSASTLRRGRGALLLFPACGTTGSWGSLRPEVVAACSLTVSRMGSQLCTRDGAGLPASRTGKADGSAPHVVTLQGHRPLGQCWPGQGAPAACGSRRAESAHGQGPQGEPQD